MPQHEQDHSWSRTYFGDRGFPALQEVRLDPDVVVSPHAHLRDQIMYVLAGEAHFGSQVCGPGSAVRVPGKTLYGFRSEPEGLTFLNFRPEPDFSFVLHDEFLERWRTDDWALDRPVEQGHPG
jgi:hypothetical protein